MTLVNVGVGPLRHAQVMKNIKPENVCHVVFQARQLRNIETVLEDDHGDDAYAGDVIDTVIADETVHQEHENDPTYLEVAGFISSLPIEAQHDLIALAWLGRGDSFKADWDGLLELAEERWTKQTSDYLLGMPLLAVYLEDALDQFGFSCEEFEDEHS